MSSRSWLRGYKQRKEKSDASNLPHGADVCAELKDEQRGAIRGRLLACSRTAEREIR
jgi:hypothetical protein